MYIPGRFLTASKPSNLSILVASYRSVLAVSLGTLIYLSGLIVRTKLAEKNRQLRLFAQTSVYTKKQPTFTTSKSNIQKQLLSNILIYILYF